MQSIGKKREDIVVCNVHEIDVFLSRVNCRLQAKQRPFWFSPWVLEILVFFAFNTKLPDVANERILQRQKKLPTMELNRMIA